MQLVKNVIINYEAIHDKEAREDDPDFQYEVSIFFLEHYPAEKQEKYFSDCVHCWNRSMNLFQSWLWEYTMYAMIQIRIEIADDMGMETQKPISLQRDYVVKVLRKMYPDQQDVSDGGEDIVITWQDKPK